MEKKLFWSTARKVVEGSSTHRPYKSMKRSVKKCFSQREKPLTLHLIGYQEHKDSFRLHKQLTRLKKSPKKRMKFPSGNYKVLLSEQASN
jgi:hypothetical protein